MVTNLNTPKDTGGGLDLHPLTRKLGELAPGNDSRDWWRLLDDGPVARPSIMLGGERVTVALFNPRIFECVL